MEALLMEQTKLFLSNISIVFFQIFSSCWIASFSMMEQKIQLLSFPPSQYINNNNDNNNNNNNPELKNLTRLKRDDTSCDHAANKYLCLPLTYSKFELPHTDSVNVVEIGIDISDVLRINDKVKKQMR
jgi:hypothetical protein